MLKIHLKKSKFRLRVLAIGLLCAGLVTSLLAMPHANAAGLTLDVLVTKKQTSPGSSITAPSFTTSQSNELLLAFIASDGPGGAGTQRISSVTGGGLTWTLRKRVNAPGTGTSEIWQAIAPNVVKNASVKATRASGSYVGMITVATFKGANLTQDGAIGGASAPSGPASASLTTTRPNSWVWGVGNDWDTAAARTLGANQTKVSEIVNTNVGDTQWVQRQTNPTATSNTNVALNTIAPTATQWNLAIIEIPSAGGDVTPPAAPVVSSPVDGATSNDSTPTFSGTGEAGATVNVSVDAAAPATTTVDAVGTWHYTPQAPLGEGSHTVRVTQTDAAGNISPASAVTTFTIDTIAPSVTINQKAGQIDPTAENNAAFTIVFSEAINAGSFTVDDLVAAGTTGSITMFSQLTPTTWEVMATGMTSGDTVTLSMIANVVIDAGGNSNTASTSTDNSVTYDENTLVAPVVTSPTSGMRISNSLPAVSGTGKDGMTIRMKVDGTMMECLEGTVIVTNGAWACTSTQPLAEGAHVITVTQVNTLGVESPESSPVSVVVDTTKPTVTVNQKAGQADPTTENRAAFTIVFSEEMNAGQLQSSDFTVSGTTGTITSLVQINATTWEAIITGMASGDTAVLELGADVVADLAGNTNSASTSTDNSVRYEAATTLLGWQLTSANTGLAPLGLTCDQLPEYVGPNKVPAGTVISEKKITKSLVLAEGGVTIERSCFKPINSDQTMVQTFDNDQCRPDVGCLPPAGLSVIRDSEFNGSLLDANPNETYNRAHVTAFKGIATLQRNYVHDVGSGLAIVAAGVQLDAAVEQNYVTNLKSWGDGGTNGTHTDAFTIRDFDGTQRPGRTAVVKNNRFNCDGGNETGALVLQAMSNINNVTIEGNLLEGYGYQMQLEIWTYASPGTSYSNVKSVNNRFSGTGYGASYVANGSGWTVWQQNYYNNPTATDNQGAPVLP